MKPGDAEMEIRRSFWFALWLHAAVLLLALFLGWMGRMENPEEPVVFELVASAPTLPQPNPKPLPEPERDEPAVPIIPDIPDFPPEPAPQPEPEPAPRVRYEDWARDRNLPDRVQLQPQPRGPVQNVPEIESDIRDRLQDRLSPIQVEGISMGELRDFSELERYISEIQVRIQRSFQPTGNDLSAEAGFDVSGGGALRNARILRSSGNAAFDQSVLRCLRSIQTPGPPPGGERSFRLTFSSE